jgi:quercetin dioxygenase-like cupin family protein
MKIKALLAHEQANVAMEGAQGARLRVLIGPNEGAKVFHMRHFEVAPGGHTPHHRHDYEHEILILRGSGLVQSESGAHPCRAGDVIWLPPNELHQFRNAGGEPLEFICLIPAPQSCTS